MKRKNIALRLMTLVFAIISIGSAFAQSPPVVVSYSPSTGSGTSGTFTGTYTDPAGASDWYRVAFIFGSQHTNVGQCYVFYYPKIKALYLDNDAGTVQVGPIQSGVPTSNSQCTVNSYSVSQNGNSITLTVGLKFATTWQDDINVWLGAWGYDNLFSGWSQLGTWSILPDSPPTIVSYSPPSGTGTSGTFTGTFNDPVGASDWYRVAFIIGTQHTNVGQCYVFYYPKIKALYLDNDAGTVPLGPIQSGVPTQNSKCSVTSYSVSQNGYSITLTVSLTFAATWQADANVWLGAWGYDNLFSGWSQQGTWSTYSHLCSSPPVYNSTDVYLDMVTETNISRESSIEFDSNGIPMVIESGTYEYNPVTIAQYALQQWSYYKYYGTPSYEANAIKMADWLVAHQDAATGEWLYTFPDNLGIAWTIPPYGSALAQGQAISVLVRAYSATGNSQYITTAEAALTPLTKPVSVGVAGLTDYFQGHPIYEESPTTPPTHILNGFMFCLFGLYDLSPYSSLAQQLYTQGVQTLDFILPYYDLGDVSAYYLGHLTAPPRHPDVSQEYHGFHVTELRGLETLNPNDSIIKYYATSWCNYELNGLASQ